jgi:hypothetical protein
VVPRHRRSEVEPSLAPLGAPVDIADNWPEPVGYGYTGGPAALRATPGPEDYRYPAPYSYDAAAPELDWTPASEAQSWQEWQGWQDWGPPPALHPDHPSAPVPRVQFAADDQWGPGSEPRPPRAADLPQRRPGASARTAAQRPPDGGYDNGQRRLYAVPDDASAVDYAPAAFYRSGNQGRQFPGQLGGHPAEPVWRDASGFWREQDSGPREAAGYQRQQTGRGRPEAIDYRYDTGPFGAGPEPATGQFQDGRSPGSDALWAAGQVITLADGQAAQIAQEAEDYAAAVREAAEREAAAITEHATSVRHAAEREAAALTERAASVRQAAEREAATITEQATGQAAAIRAAAERDAAELRAQLDSMTGELGRVAAYVTENLATPAMPNTAPPTPDALPALPDMAPALPPTRPAIPETRPGASPARPTTPPGTRPARPTATPARPRSGPTAAPPRPDSRPNTRPATTPAKKPQKRSRQQQAMRIATAGTAALLSVAVISGITEIGMKGFPFFVFRQAGTGETRPTAPTDQQFLAREAAAANHATAPKGRHHKTPSKTVDAQH